MSTTDQPRRSDWSGWVVIIAAVDIIQGLAALVKDDVYPVTKSGLLVTTDFDAWGWSLILWGVVPLLAGLALLGGKGWGRWFALVAVVINGIGQIAWLPATRCGAWSRSASGSPSSTP